MKLRELVWISIVVLLAPHAGADGGVDGPAPAVGAAPVVEAAMPEAGLPASRPRVATLLPFVEDALRQMPERVEIVAAVRRSLHAPIAPGTIDLGSPHSPNFERLVESRPDLLIGDASLHAALAPKIKPLGIELLLVEAQSVDSTFSELARIGERLGAQDDMRAAVERAQAELAGHALPEPVRVLALFGTPARFFAVTDRTWLGDLLGTMNFENVSGTQQGDERFPGLVALSDEALATMRPEVVLLVAHGDPTAVQRALERRMAGGGPWRSIRDSAGGNVHVLEARLFSANPGLGIPQAARHLAALSSRDAQ